MPIDLLDPPSMADKAKIVPAKIHADVLESARIVAAYKGVPIQDLLSDILRPILANMEREEIQKRRATWGEDEPPARRRPKGGH